MEPGWLRKELAKIKIWDNYLEIILNVLSKYVIKILNLMFQYLFHEINKYLCDETQSFKSVIKKKNQLNFPKFSAIEQSSKGLNMQLYSNHTLSFAKV